MRIEQMFIRHQIVTTIWESEMLVYHDFVRRFVSASGGIDYSQAKHSIGDMVSVEGWSSASSLPDAQLKPSVQRPLYLFNRAFYLLNGQSHIPWDDSTVGGYPYIQDHIGSVNPIFRLITGILMPATDKVSARVREYNQRSYSSRLLIALHRYRLRHGAFPETIEAIDADLLVFKPIDAFSGELLKYELTEDGPLIYSVGTDRDNDGGIPMRKYDISDLESPKNMMANHIPGYAKAPHWIRQSKVDEINQSWPEKIDGDWILYPKPKDD